jgi:DNA invertase Pin-like site-specific DNA recombinase
MSHARKAVKIALYARVSTDHQTTTNQLRELQEVAERHGWDIVGEYIDRGQSGTIAPKARPKLAELMQVVARREVDLVAAWSVDRLGRSLQDLLALLGEFHAKGVGLYLHRQGLDTTTPAGKAQFQMLGVFAKFERAMIVERVKAGLARARDKGTRSGRPIGRPRVDVTKERRIRELRRRGLGMLKIAREVGVGASVVQRVLAPRASPPRPASRRGVWHAGGS